MPRALGQKDAKTILFLLNMARRHLIPKKLGAALRCYDTERPVSVGIGAHFSAVFGSFEFRIISEPGVLYFDHGWKEGAGYCLTQYFRGELDGATPRLSNWAEIDGVFQLIKELAAN